MGPGITVLAAGGITAVGQLARGRQPSPRILIGAALTGIAVTAAAGQSPQVAAALANLILMTSLLVSGTDLAVAVSNLIAKGV